MRLFLAFMKKGLEKFNIFDIDFLKPFEGIPSHSLFSEFVAVFYDIKPVLRTYAIRPDKLPPLEKICKNYGLFAESSNFRISAKDDTVISPSGPFIYVYISKSKRLVKEAKQIEEKIFIKNQKSHSLFLRFAELMGYPKCCFNFFLNYIRKHSAVRFYLIEYDIHKNTQGNFSFYLNNLVRGDYYLISHHPCSYNCGPSIKYAKKVLSAIRKVNPKIACRIKALLKFPVLKFLNRAQYLRFINGKVKSRAEIIYKISEGDDKLNRKFKKGNRILVGRDKIEIFKDKTLVDIYKKKNELDGVIFDFK